MKLENGLKAGTMSILPDLQELQRKDNESRQSILQGIWKLYNNDLHTDFEKTVLMVKPSDCPIVQKFSKIETFPISGNDHLTEISISTMYSDHPLREYHKRSTKTIDENDTTGLKKVREQIEQIEKLPVLVFIHGLGGQMSQFEPILQEFRNCADIFSLDLPGFGNSKRPSRNDPQRHLNYSLLSTYSCADLDKLEKTLQNMTDEDFQTDNLVELLFQILNFKFATRNFIIVSHSMGTHLSIKLINKFPPGKVESLVMMSPPTIKDDSEEEVDIVNRLPLGKRVFLNSSWYCHRLFEYYRYLDRNGGLYSKSVDSYIHGEKVEEDSTNNDDLLKRLTQFRWNLDTETSIFLRYLYGFKCVVKSELLEMTQKLKTKKLFLCCGEFDKVTPLKDSVSINQIISQECPDVTMNFEVIPNSNHSIFLDKPNLLAGSVYKFVEDLNLNISCTWVLQLKALISGDKWGLKNQVKWNRVVTLSKPMINETSPDKPESHLLGMKTLRQTDELHNPRRFEMMHPEIFGIIDIGSDTPSYDPCDFRRIKYVKYKTESKVTPDNVTIIKFIEIVDKLMREREDIDQFIIVHCHYGQNRTGFLICCYLIERLGWTVNEAINAFEISKFPGIKHVHFKNALHLRYQE